MSARFPCVLLMEDDTDGLEAFHLGRRHDRDVAGRTAALDRARNARASGSDLVLSATRDLILAADLAAVVSIAQVAARRLTGADAATFAVREGNDCRYLDAGASDLIDAAGTNCRVPIGGCLSGWSMRERRPIVVDDLGLSSWFLPAFRGPTEPRPAVVQGSAAIPQAVVIHSAVVVPIRAAEPIAALGVYWAQPHVSDVVEIGLLQALAESAAAALESLRRRSGLQARADDLAALSYAVSHDLRAPIRHLEGFAQILLEDVAGLAPQAQHGAERIHAAAVRLREMVNGMLTLSRIGQTDVHPQRVDLATLGREVAQSLAAEAGPPAGPGRGGVVEFIVPEELPVTGDPRLLLAVLQDLLGNAWKFTARIPHPRVELGVSAADPVIGPGPVYFVRDNGAGFEPTSADRLFRVFARLHSGADFPGTGVGLAAVKRIVDKHGGTVRATGSPDAGATFYFTLPDRGAPAGSPLKPGRDG